MHVECCEVGPNQASGAAMVDEEGEGGHSQSGGHPDHGE